MGITYNNNTDYSLYPFLQALLTFSYILRKVVSDYSVSLLLANPSIYPTCDPS